MRPVGIVLIHPAGGDVPYLIEMAEQVHIQHVFTIGAVESLDIRVLGWLARLYDVQCHTVLLGPVF